MSQLSAYPENVTVPRVTVTYKAIVDPNICHGKACFKGTPQPEVGAER